MLVASVERAHDSKRVASWGGGNRTTGDALRWVEPEPAEHRRRDVDERNDAGAARRLALEQCGRGRCDRSEGCARATNRGIGRQPPWCPRYRPDGTARRRSTPNSAALRDSGI